MKDQDLILDLVNTEAGRFLIGDKGKERIVKITENSYHKLIGFNGKKPILKVRFYVDNRIERIFSPIIEKQRIASGKYLDIILEDKYSSFLHFSGLQKSNYLPQVYLTDTPFNPSTGWRLARSAQVGTWAEARDAATSDSDVAYLTPRSIRFSGANFLNYRAFLPFDTSSLTGATVTASDIQLYRDDTQDQGSNPFSNDSTTSIEIVQSGQASGTAYANTDYNNVTFVSKGSKTFASWTATGQYQTITITDQAQINTTGYTTLAAITGLDLSNTAPGVDEDNNIAFARPTGANPPILDVTYTLPSTATGRRSYSFFL